MPAFTAAVIAVIAVANHWRGVIDLLFGAGPFRWLAVWVIAVGPVVAGSLACWAFDGVGKALSRPGRSEAPPGFSQPPAHTPGWSGGQPSANTPGSSVSIPGPDPASASQQPPTANAPRAFDLSEAIGWAWHEYSANAGGSIITAVLQVVAVVLAAGGFGLLYAVGMHRGPAMVLTPVAYGLITAVMMATCQAFYVSGAVAVLRRERASIHDFFGNPRLPTSFGAAVLTGAIVALGNVVLILLGLIALLLVQYAVFFVADTGMGAWQSIAASARPSTANLGTSLMVIVALAILNGLGGLVCGIGLLVTVPVGVLLQARAYGSLTRRPAG